MASLYTLELGIQQVQPKNGVFSLQEIIHYVGRHVHIVSLDEDRVAIISQQDLWRDENRYLSVKDANKIKESLSIDMGRSWRQLGGLILICSRKEAGMEE